MLAPRWSKVLRDLAHNRTRTLLVVLSIAVGVFAFGTILTTREVVERQLRTTFLATNPASATITTSPFDEELAEAAAGLPGVAAAEGRRAVEARIVLPDGGRADIRLFVLPDDGATQIGIIRPEAGAWPPPNRALLIERSSLAKAQAALGATITVELPGGRTRAMPVAGLTYDLSLPPAPIAGQAFGYITAETLAWLGGAPGYNQLKIVVAEGRTDKAHITRVAGEVERLIERSGRPVIVTDVPTPLQHPVELILPTMILIMTIFGTAALLISGFLIVNTISAILTQQTRQIGIMKAIGARSGQLMGMYFALVAVFGLLALLIAAPLAIVGAMAMGGFLGSQLNIDMAGLPFSPRVIAIQAAAAVLVPVLTAALPIRSVVSRTVREAISGDTAPPAGASPLDRILAHAPISRPARLSLRNTFRRKGRLARTMIALSLGGAVFVGVISLRESLFDTLDASIAGQRYDIEVLTGRPYRDARLTQAALSAPGVVGAEAGRYAAAFPVRPDATTGEVINLRALPPASAMFAPSVDSGRWLLPADERAIVLSTNFALKEAGAAVGSRLTLQIGDSEDEWVIVGFVDELVPAVSPAIGYVPLAALSSIVGGPGKADTIRVTTAGHDAASHDAAARALEAALEERGLVVGQIKTRTDDRRILDERFNVLTGILSIVATIIGTVGGLGLAGTMSINVLERSKEIGILRAIGASDGAIRRIVIGEGLVIGLLAWALGALLAMPITLALCDRLGRILLNAPFEWRYSLPGAAAWLAIVLVIATLASLLPARAATRVTVREVLAYE